MAPQRLKPSRLIGQDIERFYQEVANALSLARTSDELTLDLSSLDFIVPEGMIALATVGGGVVPNNRGNGAAVQPRS